MNFLYAFIESPFAIALGWALLHFLWQGAALTLGAALSLRWLRGHAPEARYSAGLGALLLMAAMPVLTMLLIFRATPAPGLPDAQVVLTEEVMAMGAASAVSGPPSVALPAHADAPSRVRALWAGWVAFFWLAGVSAMSLRLLGGLACARRLRSYLVQQAGEPWEAMVQTWRERLDIGRVLEVLQSPLVDVPLVTGWLRPALLLPREGLRLLDPQQVEALIIHELSHVKRNDYLVNLLQCLLETLLFFHPGVWWVSSRVRLEREVCCDAITVRLHQDRDAYADALVALESMRHSGLPTLSVAALRPGQLLRRIQRLYETPPPETGRRPWGVVLVATLAVLLCAVTVVKAQAPATATAVEETVAEAPESSAEAQPAVQQAAGAVTSPNASPAESVPGVLLTPMDIVGSSRLSEAARQLDVLLATRLSSVEAIRLVERVNTDAAMKELQLAQTGLVAQGGGLELGRLRGANYAVHPKLMQLDGNNMVSARVVDSATSEFRQVEISVAEEEGLSALADAMVARLTELLAARPPDAADSASGGEDIARVRAALAGMTLPRVTVSVPEFHLGTFVPDPAGEIEMMKTLGAIGFPVVDVDTLARRRENTSWLDLFFDRNADDGDFGVALRSGLENASTLEHNEKIKQLKSGTDLFLLGEAFSEHAGEVHGFQSCQARLEIKAVDVASGRVAAADSRHANAADLGELIAGKKALREAGRQTALAIAPVLARYWQNRPAEQPQ
jgi:beta-lactamase regulating signal transducer with metallopeptidase domain